MTRMRITADGAHAFIEALCSWTSETDIRDERAVYKALIEVFDSHYPDFLWEGLAERLTHYIAGR